MTDPQLEKASDEYADNIKISTSIPGALVPLLHDIAKDSYRQGAQNAIASQWIPVDERLPEDDRYFYLVADARLDPLGIDCAEYTCETKLFSRNGKILHPTHWCAIPQFNPEKEER